MPVGTSPVEATRAASRVGGAARWLRARAPEVAIFAFGVFLRVTMAYRFNPEWAVDAATHWEVVQWMAEHAALPPQDTLLQAQHPPLFYTVAALLLHHGVSRAQLAAFPILFGIIRLALFWAGLEWLLPKRRWVCLPALALAAVLPVSVYMDGCQYPEPLHATFVAAALLAIVRAFGVPVARRWRSSALAGLFMGLALLTKVTGLVVLVAVAVAVVSEILFARPGDRTSLLARVAPWSAMLGVCAALSSWYYVRNFVHYHKPFLTSFDLTERDAMDRVKNVPLLDRRTLGFFVGWDASIYTFPYVKLEGPSFEHPRFLTLAMASTFVDYYNQSYSGLAPQTPGPVRSGPAGSVHSHILTPRLVALGSWSAVAGTVIMLVSVAAGLLWAVRSFRARHWGPFLLAILPFVTTAFQLYAALKYPFDDGAVVKASYMQFGMLPLVAAFGFAVEWTRCRKRLAPLSYILLAALWVVTAYSVYCRTGITLLPVTASALVS